MSMRHLGVELAWIAAVGSALMMAVSAPAAAAGNVAGGKAVFRSHCAICHSTLPGRNKVGPSLFGVVGRKSGSEPGYNYSAAMKNSDLVWTEDELEKYLKSPHAIVPGTKMSFPGLQNPQQRADVIAYLATLK